MAAYASIVSLMNLIEQIQLHPSPPIALHKQHAESLCKNLTFLQEFLEVYPKAGGDGLESRITDAAYAAEDVIESHVVDQILGGSKTQTAEIELFHRDLQQVVLDVDAVTKEATKLRNQDRQLRGTLVRDGLKRAPSVRQKNAMVGFDDVSIEVMDKLTGDQCSRRVIPIVGMGGIGKTTLANNAYEHHFVVCHFDIRSWVTISQDYDVKEILVKVLLDLNVKDSRERLSRMSEGELGDKLYKSLYGRRYLIVMDDMWSIDVWDKVKCSFPDNNNRSRIMITTRLSSVASMFRDTILMNFLDDDDSWNLLCKVVFGEKACPVELERSGRKIAKDCKGLPLSLVVMGGLLVKSEQTKENWISIAEKLNSSFNLEHEEHCLKILHTSYDHLPVYLKPCFLYMGIYSEDSEISASSLMKLWVAEGFVKAINEISLESSAQEYLMDLIDRNLVLIKRFGSSGKIKACNVHDLVRDLCTREVEKEKFASVMWKHNLDIRLGLNVQRRMAISRGTIMGQPPSEVLDALRSASLARSLTYDWEGLSPVLPSKLLRVFNAVGQVGFDPQGVRHFTEAIFQLVNLRFLAFYPAFVLEAEFPSSIYRFWNLQTLIIGNTDSPHLEIWKLHQLRHVKATNICLPDPPSNGQADEQEHEFVLWNLQTLSSVMNFRCGEEVARRIPNIRKLKIVYPKLSGEFSDCYLNNLNRLKHLESLSCNFMSSQSPSRNDFLQNFSLPHSLVKLELKGTYLHWEDISTRIGSLPLLRALKLVYCVQGRRWNSVEGKFRSLRFLQIQVEHLESWITESNHFPKLEHLFLVFLDKLKEVPPEIGDIPKLQLLKLLCCSNSAVKSAQRILDEQEKLGNCDLKVRVCEDLDTYKYVELHPNVEDEL